MKALSLRVRLFLGFLKVFREVKGGFPVRSVSRICEGVA